jgi:hypothetical protein
MVHLLKMALKIGKKVTFKNSDPGPGSKNIFLFESLVPDPYLQYIMNMDRNRTHTRTHRPYPYCTGLYTVQCIVYIISQKVKTVCFAAYTYVDCGDIISPGNG